MKSSILIGTDPELFLYNTKLDSLVKAGGIIPGNKYVPYEVNLGAIQVDGLAAEFNIAPAKNEKEFDKHISTVVDQLRMMVNEVDKNLELVFSPVGRFDPDYWEQEVEMMDRVLGCDPDFNADGDINEVVEGFQDMPFRTAAGHIHIGWGNGFEPYEPLHMNSCIELSRLFKTDEKLVHFQARTDEEKERIKFYGGNGAFRPKKYGVELRSPSNLWVADSYTRQEMFCSVYDKMRELQYA